MASVDALKRRAFAETGRRDAWWLQPLATFLALSTFVVYATWAAFQGDHYHFGPYLSPFYSPELFGDSPHALFGPKPAWWPGAIPFSAALLILWAPGGFRFTCYYYRGAYYKSFWGDPPACSVGEPRKKYLGERSLPLVLQNVHRYFLYLALGFIFVLAFDAWKGLWFVNAATGAREFGVGVGSLVLLANVAMLGSYTFSCHSFRHLVGGRKDSLAKVEAALAAYRCVSKLNTKHMVFAWASLCTVGFADLYVRLCSMGVWSDWRLF